MTAFRMKKQVLGAALIGAFASGSNAQETPTELEYTRISGYQIIEVDTQSLAQNTFAQLVDNSDSLILSANQLYQVPIDTSLLDFDSEAFVALLTDPAAVQAGQFNLEDYTYLRSVLSNAANSNNQFVQQVAEFSSFKEQDGQLTYLAAFDEISQSDDFSHQFETDTRVYATSTAGHIIGVADGPFITQSYTTEDGDELTYVLPAFGTRAFVQTDDSVVPLMSPESALGGFSEAYDINERLEVVGMATVALSESSTTGIENCNNDEERADVPIDACFANLRNAGALTNLASRRGMLWQLDNNGEVIDTRVLPLAFEPEADDLSSYRSRANAINDNGVIVGESNIRNSNNFVTTSAVIFQGEQANEIFSDEELHPSSATDVNNSGLVIGNLSTQVNGRERSKFFLYDVNTGDITRPNDFFDGSSSVARGINDFNFVIGQGEVESTLSGTRRRHAFIYDAEHDEFVDMNGLVGCTDDYTLIDAIDINDNNVVAANALVKRPRRDALGNIELDNDGNPIIEDRVVAVKLVPDDTITPQDCRGQVEPITRQGSASSIIASVFLLLLVASRRLISKSLGK